MEMNTNVPDRPPEAVAEASAPSSSRDESVGQYVTFYVEKEFFAFPLASVLEIIRVIGRAHV